MGFKLSRFLVFILDLIILYYIFSIDLDTVQFKLLKFSVRHNV